MNLSLILATFLYFGSIQILPAQEPPASVPLTNADVVKLVKGGLSKDLIVHTINVSPHRFDLSANGLLDLKDSGVPDDVIRSMVSRQNQASSSKDAVQKQGDEVDPLWLYDGEKKLRMEKARMELATRVTLVSAFGGPGYAYATFPESGPAATLRVPNKKPSFGEFAVPLDLRVAELVNLVKLELESNTKRRRVQLARISVFGNSRQGIPEGARIPVVFSEMGEQVSQGKRVRMYRMAPVNPLEPGEYAIVVSMKSFLDFGIDPEKD